MYFVKKILITIVIILVFFVSGTLAFDLKEIKARGELRHLAIPYANFVTGAGDGFSVELIKLFAKHLGVKYTFVKSDWKHIISDLTGKKIQVAGNTVKVIGECKIRGDIIEAGLTILDWRKKLVDYSNPVFPTQIWLVSSAASKLRPITPTGNIEWDIQLVLNQLKGSTVLSVENTCLDAELYDLTRYGAKIIWFRGKLNDLVPAVIKGESDATLLDVPDALVALDKFSSLIKVIGPITKEQFMASAFRKTSPNLRKEYNRFLKKIKKEGSYLTLVKKYYPFILEYYPSFFK